MTRREVFIDTSALLALVNRSDALHARAKTVYDELLKSRTLLICSEWVLAEFLNGAARRLLRSAGIRMVGRIRASRRASILPVSEFEFEAVLDFYSRRADKEWSFVDCTSMMICQHRGVEHVFGHDHHFKQFGLELLL